VFQNTATVPNNLEEVLKLEMDYFNSVLNISEKVVKQVESLPVSVLVEMVNYRKEWIEKIQKLENRRKELDTEMKTDSENKYIKNISKLASKLVKIDDKIYKNLEQRKMQYVEESAAISGQKTYSNRQKSDTMMESKISIIQE
jgi:ABC-type phosphate transport system auxiliary subunit